MFTFITQEYWKNSETLCRKKTNITSNRGRQISTKKNQIITPGTKNP